jgi:hypothetical protein
MSHGGRVAADTVTVASPPRQGTTVVVVGEDVDMDTSAMHRLMGAEVMLAPLKAPQRE